MNPDQTRAAAPARKRKKTHRANPSENLQRLITGSGVRRGLGYPSLRAWRLERELSQLDAAALLEISQTLYSRLERGTVSTKGATARRIMLVTGVPLEILVGAV